jgi:hypothetical protein
VWNVECTSPNVPLRAETRSAAKEREVGSKRHRPSILKGAAAGALGGALGALATNAAHAELTQLLVAAAMAREERDARARGGAPRPLTARERAARLAASIRDIVYGEAAGAEDDGFDPKNLYLFGIAAGAIYGAVVERVRFPTAVSGLLFGAALWALDERGSLPPGLPRSGGEAERRAAAFLEHAVFAVTLESVRRGFREPRWNRKGEREHLKE